VCQSMRAERRIEWSTKASTVDFGNVASRDSARFRTACWSPVRGCRGWEGGGGGDLRAYIVAEAMIIPAGYSMYSIFYRCGHDGAWRDRQETGWEWEWKRGRRVLREDPVDRRPLGSRGKQKPTSRATLFGCGQKKKERERKRKAPSITHSLTDPSRLGSASRAGGGGNNGLYSHSVYVCVHAFYFYFWSRTRTQPHSK